MKKRGKEGMEEESQFGWLLYVISDGILINTVAQCSENKSSPNLLEKNVHIFNDA